MGQDVNSQAVELARERPLFQSLPNSPEFVVSDYEHLPFEDEFDAVVFFDSLHHATDLAAAIASARRALKPGGRMIASEPGVGHANSSREVVAEYGVTDNDTLPSLTLRLGRKAGFSQGHVYPHAALLGHSLYRNQNPLGGTGFAFGAYGLSHGVRAAERDRAVGKVSADAH